MSRKYSDRGTDDAASEFGMVTAPPSGLIGRQESDLVAKSKERRNTYEAFLAGSDHDSSVWRVLRRPRLDSRAIWRERDEMKIYICTLRKISFRAPLSRVASIWRIGFLVHFTMVRTPEQ